MDVAVIWINGATFLSAGEKTLRAGIKRSQCCSGLRHSGFYLKQSKLKARAKFNKKTLFRETRKETRLGRSQIVGGIF